MVLYHLSIRASNPCFSIGMSGMIYNLANEVVVPDIAYGCQVCIHRLTGSLKWLTDSRITKYQHIKVNKKGKKIHGLLTSLFLPEPQPSSKDSNNNGSIGSRTYSSHGDNIWLFSLHDVVLKTNKEYLVATNK